MSKSLLQKLLKNWIKWMSLINKALISIWLLIIWIVILTPTALLRKLFQALKKQQKNKSDSFLKRSTSLDPKHFTRPF